MSRHCVPETTIEQKLDIFVDRDGGPHSCWEWTRGTQYGYGQASDADGRIYRMHRVAWELANGPIVDDLCVLHRCDNRRCCNPAHLFLGTRADNNRDMDAKGRRRSRRRVSQDRADDEDLAGSVGVVLTW